MKNSNKFLYLIFIVCGYVFIKSGYGKVSGGMFVQTLGDTLGKFASKNPYPWYKSFLETTAIPNSIVFGTLTMWGELLAGVSILLGSVMLLMGRDHNLSKLLLLVGLVVAAFLNATFWFASGWTSASTDSLNLVMFLVELIGIMFVVKTFSHGK